jgi:hypothetical protein
MTSGEFYLAYLCLRTIRTRYPAFTLYISFLALKSVALMFVATQLDPLTYFYAYYAAGFVACGLEISVVIEVFAVLFKPYRYVPRRILITLAIGVPTAIAVILEGNLILWHGASRSAFGDYRLAELCATYAVLVLFGGLFCFSSYFAMQWRSRLTGITIGMFIDSVSSVITATLIDKAAIELLAFLPVLSFSACIVIWIRYIRRPEELRAVIGLGEKQEIRTMLSDFVLCLEETPTSCRPGDKSQQQSEVNQ